LFNLLKVSKEHCTGNKRQFLCRILSEKNTNEHLVTQFTAVLKNQIIKPSSLSSTPSNLSMASTTNNTQNQHRLFKKRFTSYNSESNNNNSEFSNSSNEVFSPQSIYQQQQSQITNELSQILYYIVLHGQIEPKVSNIYDIELVNRLDLDGTFIQVDSRLD
jgi:hypothetical protein